MDESSMYVNNCTWWTNGFIKTLTTYSSKGITVIIISLPMSESHELLTELKGLERVCVKIASLKVPYVIQSFIKECDDKNIKYMLN